ncbi:aldose epimerase family protein [Clostridium sp. AL.422]|uniref:aldose epimerase family protein n=1 Tax=Clostridium TaxID=1485 RepID=UPI00293DA96C|nr:MULTISPECIES: aldose epimerase family protein [unclassified Clostridium]MDV4149331.1 aldose epimerase family protein [Clostridium sp. AL.422]
MSIVEQSFGITENCLQVKSYTLTNKNKMEVKIITYGGAIAEIKVPDKNGDFGDVVLGYDSIEGYESGKKFHGALIGRCGNRIENSRFTINGEEYILAANDGVNHLHGGIKGFDKVVWDSEIIDDNNNILKLSYLSKDGEEGYPGNLKVDVYYSLTEDNELKIEYKAISDKDTVINLTNHSYFNLRGHSSNNILDQKLMVNADSFTVNDKYSIPTGEIRSVEGTPMNFKALKNIGEDIDDSYEQIQFGQGYDHNWLLNAKGDLSVLSAKLVDEVSGRALEMYTTNVGVQVYTGNFLDGSEIGKDNVAYERRSGVCLETQYVPNAVNDSNFESSVFKANEEYNHTTIYKFTTI